MSNQPQLISANLTISSLGIPIYIYQSPVHFSCLKKILSHAIDQLAAAWHIRCFLVIEHGLLSQLSSSYFCDASSCILVGRPDVGYVRWALWLQWILINQKSCKRWRRDHVCWDGTPTKVHQNRQRIPPTPSKNSLVCLCDRDDHYSNPSCDGLVTSGNASGQHRVWKNINLTSLDSIGHVLCLQSAWPPSSYWTWKSARWECNFQEGLRLLAIKHAQCCKKSVSKPWWCSWTMV